MSAPDFLDSNVLIYAYDPSAKEKQSIAAGLLRQAMAGTAVISAQVVAEFAAAYLHKIKPPLPAVRVQQAVDAWRPIRTVMPDADLVVRALEAHHRYKVHFYDGMIVAAAERAGCGRILSEELTPGQKYFGISVQNPFQRAQ